MTVYVDDVGIPASVGGRSARWSHLIADTRDELHEFASRLGLKRAWFQDPVVSGKPKAKPGSRHAENWHYDVTASKRAQAIRLGAIAVTWRELPGIIDARYSTAQGADQGGSAPAYGFPDDNEAYSGANPAPDESEL